MNVFIWTEKVFMDVIVTGIGVCQSSRASKVVNLKGSLFLSMQKGLNHCQGELVYHSKCIGYC